MATAEFRRHLARGSSHFATLTRASLLANAPRRSRRSRRFRRFRLFLTVGRFRVEPRIRHGLISAMESEKPRGIDLRSRVVTAPSREKEGLIEEFGVADLGGEGLSERETIEGSEHLGVISHAGDDSRIRVRALHD